MDKKRNVGHKISRLLKMFPIVAVIGPRQCGKSTLVKNLKPDWKYYDLENPDDYRLIIENPTLFFELNQQNIIIDEAQAYPDLFKVLRGVVDGKRGLKGRFLLTGSSSPEIVKGLTESLAGRIATVELSPFKANEYYEQELAPFYQCLLSENPIEELLNLTPERSLKQTLDIWLKGGFPDPLIESEGNEEFSNQWKANYINDYIRRDIRALFPRLNIHNYQRFLQALTHYSGQQVNNNAIARALEISASTIKDYLDIIHQTFIWRNLPSFEKNPLKKVQKNSRGFFRDSGLLHFLLKIRSLDELQIHPIAGHSFESFVVEEIIRGIEATLSSTQADYFYYRTIDRSEVDLILDTAVGVIPIEIKLASKVQRKSLKGLENLIADMNCNYGIVVNTGSRVERLSEKIIQIPVNLL